MALSRLRVDTDHELAGSTAARPDAGVVAVGLVGRRYGQQVLLVGVFGELVLAALRELRAPGCRRERLLRPVRCPAVAGVVVVMPLPSSPHQGQASAWRVNA